MADRFQGTSPLDYKYMPADDRAVLLKIMGVEGEINSIWYEAKEDSEPGQEVWIAQFEYELWDDE